MKSAGSLNSLVATAPHLQLQIHEAPLPACRGALPANTWQEESRSPSCATPGTGDWCL